MFQEEKQGSTETLTDLASPSTCFACGPDNLRGLHLHFQLNENDEMIAEWTPEPSLEGYTGMIHGGLISTVLDEAMAKIVAAKRRSALTVELRVRFRRKVATGDKVVISGWLTRCDKRVINAEAKITATDGTELAHGWGIFLGAK